MEAEESQTVHVAKTQEGGETEQLNFVLSCPAIEKKRWIRNPQTYQEVIEKGK